MSRLELSHELLAQSARTTADVARAVDRSRARLGRRADDLLSSGWRGEAASLFAEGMRTWDAGAADVLAALAATADLIDEANRDFARTDATRSSALRASGSGLGPGAGSGALNL